VVLHYRDYGDYEAYTKHQSSKFKRVKNPDKLFTRQYNWLLERIGSFLPFLDGRNALCLGARSGSEVAAFRDLGFKAIGIDLNPGKESDLVIPGDFHDIPFEDGSFDVVYFNSIDHALDVRKISQEIHRVLVPNGQLALEISTKLSRRDAKYFERSGIYESLVWDKTEDVVATFEEFQTEKDLGHTTKRKKEWVGFVLRAKNAPMV